jgi:large subunit ribosomal protein L25
MYGEGIEALSLAVDARELGAALSTEAGINALLDLHLGSDQHLAMARELTRDPIKGSIIHVDFYRVDRNKAIEIDVPIHFEGTPKGVSEGGVLEHHLWQLRVSCLPTGVPERIEFDVAALIIGDSVRVGDAIVQDGVTILTDPDEIIAAVIVPQILEVEAPEEVAAAEAAEAAAAEAAEGEEGEAPAEAPAEGSGDES